METKIDAEELADILPSVLERVRQRGERFVIECEGEPIARLAPAAGKPGITWHELAEALRDNPWPDEDFAKDLEEIHAAQPLARIPEWPD